MRVSGVDDICARSRNVLLLGLSDDDEATRLSSVALLYVLIQLSARAGSGVVRIDSLSFLAGCRTGSVCLSCLCVCCAVN